MEQFIKELAKALAAEFKFIGGGTVTGNEEAWETAARGVAEKMGFEQVIGSANVDGHLVQNIRFMYPKEGK